MNKMRWFDRNGVELHQGDIVRDVNTGEEELVYSCYSADYAGIESLGINASNEAFLKLHPEWPREVYPFTNFLHDMVNGERHLVFFEKVV